MKYIRTKDGRIIETSTFEKDLTHPLEEPYVGEGIGMYYGVPIVKASDSIEELCDKFVFETLHGMEIRTSYVESRSYISRYKKVYPAFIKEAYGAIWTERGLIYVAKFNKEGEWELL